MHKVTHIPSDPGRAPWNALLPAAAPATPLDGPVTADWLVIGAGFAGLAAARRLTQLRPSERIVVLEARRVGEGPAGRNSGFMMDVPHDLASDDYGGAAEHDRAQTAMNRAAIAFAAEAVEEYGLPREAFDPAGKVNGAVSAKGDAHNRSYAAHLARLGEPFEMLDAAAMREMTGTGFYVSGLYTPGTVMLQPAMFVRGIATGLARAGVAIHEESPVTGLDRAGGDWCATTPGGRVTAPRVILAVNGHAEAFGQFTRRLVHIFLYGSMTRALSAGEVARLGGAPRWGITPSDPMGTTVRRISGTGGDRIIVRNRVTYDPSMEVPEARLTRIAADHDRSFTRRFPMLKGVEMEHRWAGQLCLSLNGVHAFGETEPGLFAACCQNGLGTVKGTLTGMCAVDLAAGGNAPMAAALLADDPPKRLPPEPFATIGARATLRWREWRAREEL